MKAITRRELIAGVASSGVTAVSSARFAHAAEAPAPAPAPGHQNTGFIDILRLPNSVTAFSGLDQPVSLQRSGHQWSGAGLQVATAPASESLSVTLAAPSGRPTHLHLRWNTAVDSGLLILGDAWERSYGDLHWASLVPERAMPWYFLASRGAPLHGYGVKTGAGALCFWQIDPDGISLWLNVCNGGSGVELGERTLQAATVVSRQGEPGESQLEAASAFCRKLCDAPRPASIVYGSNDWYYAYGHNTAEQIVRDAELVSSLAPAQGPRPFTVIDDGWKNKAAYPDMAALAASIHDRRVRPGLWIRPLEAPSGTAPGLLLPSERFDPHTRRSAELAYDPTVPDALAAVLAKVTQATGWGYELVKHDFSTYDLLGQWGFEMHADPTLPGWSFHDRSQTNAEIIRSLYQSIRHAAGDRTLLVGCNTIGHLGAGLFDAQRTGDDVSGKLWERTRRMGVNTLAFRIPQHRSFFALDADCVPITTQTPWSCNRLWLDLLARSGTVLLVSPEPAATGAEQRQALREAFAVAAAGNSHVASADSQANTTPDHWSFHANPPVEKDYDWYQQTGAWPFGI